ncbi:phage tail tape measure protein [Escherichia coli]|nr:phage tail tape measure protein [Escherichia coli]
MAEFELKALITGVDRLSPALSKMQKKIRGFKRQAEEASQGGLALGGGLAAGLTLSLKSYADQENAATGLKVAMMDANGEVGKSFQDINKLAIGLGNQLPGTTADFQNMMQMLVRQGIPAENILGGVGKATAYLAVQLKKTPEAAAEFAAKMQDATGTASEDMMGLFDTIQKAFYLGVDDTNMLSFFTKTSSVLKMVNKDGLQAAQSLAPISVMMDQMGMNGESAGNALRKVIQSGLSVKKIRDVNKIMARQKLGVQLDFTDGKGSFGGLDNMFRQLAKLRKLTDVKRTGVLKAIFGDDAETLQVVNALIDKGKDGYDQIQQKMNKQASLNKRVQAQLGTLSNLWEAMTGTATNGLAAIGGAFSGDAKNITQWLGELGEKFTKFADKNPRVIRGVVGLAAGLAILKLGLMGVGGAISIVSRIMSMTPIGMIATAIALAAGLIITNWDVVGPYFKKLWETIGPYFEAGWELLKKVFAWSPLGMVINNWGPVVKWFQDMWDKLKPIIEWFTDSSGDTVDAINSAQWGAGAYDAYGTGIPARGYTPYSAVDLAQSNNASGATGPNPFMINKASAPKVDGEIKVSFVNSPSGIAPPDIPVGFVAVFNSDEASWHLVEDHRGKTVYDVASGDSLFISELGPLPENITWLSPEGEFQKWNGTAWVKDTEAEKLFRIREAEETKNSLMQVASEHIAPLQDAADLEIATEEETSLLEAWKKYRVLLNRVDTSTAPDIEWPAIPVME